MEIEVIVLGNLRMGLEITLVNQSEPWMEALRKRCL